MFRPDDIHDDGGDPQEEPHGFDRRRLLAAAAGLALAGGALPATAAGGTARRAGAARGAAGGPLKGKKFGMTIPFAAEFFTEFFHEFQVEAKKVGIQTSVVSADNSPAKAHQQADTFIAQGFDAIDLQVSPVTGWESTVARARKKGICVVGHLGEPLTGLNQLILVDHAGAGAGVGRVAAEWAQKTQNGKVFVGLLVSTDPGNKMRTDAARDTLLKLVPSAKIVASAVGPGDRQKAAASAANMLQAHGEINMIIGQGDEEGIGAYTAAREAGKTDPNKFFVGSVDGTNFATDLVAKGGTYHVTWSFLFPFSAALSMRDVLRCLQGKYIYPTRAIIGYPVTKQNAASYKKLIANPQAPNVQWIYSDADIFRYSPIPLDTGDKLGKAFPGR